MTKTSRQKFVLAGTGIIFTSLSLLIYPAKAEQACVRTTAGQRVCGELLPKEGGNVAQKLEANEFTFELQGCQRSGDNVKCNVLITNVGESDRELSVANDSRMISTSGEEFKATEVQFGQTKSSSDITLRLIRGVPIKAVLSFKGTPSRVSNIAALDVIYHTSSSSFQSIAFRNVAIQK